METIIFLASFVFSFILFLLGVQQKSFIFSISGSLLLLLLSLILVSVGIQSASVKTILLNITNSTGDLIAQDKLDVKITSSLSDYMTYSFGFVMGIFSCFFLLYSVWRFIMSRRVIE